MRVVHLGPLALVATLLASSCGPKDFAKVNCPPVVLVPRSCDQAFALYVKERSVDLSSAVDLPQLDVDADLQLRGEVVQLGEEMDQVTQRLALALKSLCQEERAVACDAEAAEGARGRKERLLTRYAAVERAVSQLARVDSSDSDDVSARVRVVQDALAELEGEIDPERYPMVAVPGWRPRGSGTTVSPTGILMIGAREVDLQLWNRHMASDAGTVGPSTTCQTWDGPELPASCMTWCEAAAFANRLSEADGLQPAYSIERPSDGECAVERVQGADGYRLPTRAEWLAAASPHGQEAWAGHVHDAASCKHENLRDQAAFGHSRFDAWHDRPEDFLACDDGQAGPWAPGSRGDDDQGPHDLIGNVAEWVEPDSVEPNEPALDDEGALPQACGGSFGAEVESLASAPCSRKGPGYRDDTVGLRLVREL